MKADKRPMNDRGRASDTQFLIMMALVIPLAILFGYIFISLAPPA